MSVSSGYGRKLERVLLDTFGNTSLHTMQLILLRDRDGGLAMVAYLKDITSTKLDATVPSQTARLLRAQNPARLSVLELGCGCGMVGIALAQMRPRCEIYLTDLPEAMGILEQNISVAQPAEGSSLTSTTLDWYDEVPFRIRETVFDVILVSECTYNSDSLPALVKTLSSLVSISMEARIILSTKVRHSSEAAFFEMMLAAGFIELEHSSIKLPDPLRSQRGDLLELVEMYVFHHKDASLRS